jgi:ribosome-associated translation inhibitor RaiA
MSMNVDIQGQDFLLTSALTDHARRRLQFGLTRHSDRIQRIVVRLGDKNGPRGGVDKFCRIQVYLFDAPVAVVEDIGLEMYAVIDRAADRVGRLVVKHLDRSRIGRRHGRGDRGGATPALPDEFDATPDPAHSEGERA